MKRREAEARQALEDARLDVIRACGELRESEMFLSAVMADERSAVGGAAAQAASSADVANTHQSNIREQVQPRKVIHADYAPGTTRRVSSSKKRPRCKRRRSSSGRPLFGTGSMRGVSLALRVI